MVWEGNLYGSNWRGRVVRHYGRPPLHVCIHLLRFKVPRLSSRLASFLGNFRTCSLITTLQKEVQSGGRLAWLDPGRRECLQSREVDPSWRTEKPSLLRPNGRFEIRRWSRTIGDAMSKVSLNIAGKPVPLMAAPGVSDSDVQMAVTSNVLQQWIRLMTTGPDGILSLKGSEGPRCSLRRLTVQNVDYFGSRVGFLKFKADVVDEQTGAKLPGIVFGRGGAVAVLILLQCEGVKYAVLVEQARVPAGRMLLELPAGMLDADAGDIVGSAIREVEEETGIKLRASDLVDLTALLDEGTGRRMLPSAGSSDEDIALFLYRGRVDKEVVKALEGAETGLRDHGELINTRVVPYSSLWRCTSDSMVLCAVALYEIANREGLLPPAPEPEPPKR